MREKLFEFIQKNFISPLALLGGILLILVVILPLDQYIERFVNNYAWRLMLYLVILLAWWFAYVIVKYYLPKNRGGIGIIIGIKTENDKQKTRLRNDFIKQLSRSLEVNNLCSKVNLLVLNNIQSQKVGTVLGNYSKKVDEIIATQKVLERMPDEIKNWLNIQKRVKGHFYIWGDIKERLNQENTYFFEIEALAIHKPVDLIIHQSIKKDFLSLWSKIIYFKEKDEYGGFKISAALVSIPIKYIIGLAAFLAHDYSLASQLHTKLKQDLDGFKPLPKNLVEVYNNLPGLLAEKNYQIARSEYSKGEISNCRSYIDQAINLVNNTYGPYLMRAIIEYLVDKDPQKALSTIYLAKRNAGKNGTWRYSEGFLLMDLGRFPEALKVYDEIINYEFPDENLVLDEVYQFNEGILKNNPGKLHSLFILGLLKYKKDQKYPLAYKYFDDFLKKANSSPNYSLLVTDATKYKIELEQFMGIKNN